MKIAVLNNSGNVGKTTIARHLLAPRMGNCPILFVETINEGGSPSNYKGKNFKTVLTELNLLDNAIVDIGSSNIEAVYDEMRRMRKAHEEFDFYVVPAVPALKQQRDTANTIATLLELGIAKSKIRLVFNMVEDRDPVQEVFPDLVEQARQLGIATDAVIYQNELYQIIGTETVAENIADIPLLKQRLAKEEDQTEKRVIATAIGVSRLASGVQEDLDKVFASMFPAVTENATAAS